MCTLNMNEMDIIAFTFMIERMDEDTLTVYQTVRRYKQKYHWYGAKEEK